MKFRLPRALSGFLAAILVSTSILVHVPLLLLATLAKAVLRVPAWRPAFDRVLMAIAESWIAINSGFIDVFTDTRFFVEGVDGLRPDGHYLVLANHRSWVDIPVMQKVLNRRIPLLRFFLKSQLFWIPFMGLAWWALDFPFMKRYPKSKIAKNPELAGKDIEATRRACEKFRDIPVSIMNFVEGTRFTPAKHAAQKSPFRHLLKPKAGGVAFVIGAMGEGIESVLDVTLWYDTGKPGLVDLFTDRIGEVRMHVVERRVPPQFAGRDYETDRAFRVEFQAWLNTLWAEKDARLEAWSTGGSLD